MSDNNKNLYYLDELPDYHVATDYYDVRGWDVIDAENQTIGKVTNLLVNKQAKRVVYLDVEVDKSLIEVSSNTYQVPANDGVINKDVGDHIIVPIGMVCLNKEQNKVLTNQIDYNTFVKARRFNRGAVIDRNYEWISFSHYLGYDTIDVTILDDNFYKQKEFDNSLHRRET